MCHPGEQSSCDSVRLGRRVLWNRRSHWEYPCWSSKCVRPSTSTTMPSGCRQPVTMTFRSEPSGFAERTRRCLLPEKITGQLWICYGTLLATLRSLCGVHGFHSISNVFFFQHKAKFGLSICICNFNSYSAGNRLRQPFPLPIQAL